MLQMLRCVHCVSGIVVDGVCTSCGKPDSEDTRPANALPARTLFKNQYIIGRVLGSGGYGITYLAWDNKQNRRIAIKELFPKQMAERTESVNITVNAEYVDNFQHTKQRFCEEAQILYELRNAAEVLQVYQLFEENGTAYYVMEYLEGSDMKNYLKKNGVMSWAELIIPIGMVCRALYALHGRGLIHRDISPDNIFLTNNGLARLIDFGSARCYTGNKAMTSLLKPHFAPYEQYREQGRQGPYTDIYSLSVTIYYALSGQLPPASLDRMLALRQGHGSYAGVVPLEQMCKGVPVHVIDTVMRGMAVHPEDRIQTIEEFAAGLFPSQNILGIAKNNSGKNIKNPQEQQNGQQNQRVRRDTNPRPQRQVILQLQCVQGHFRGRIIQVQPGTEITIGREPSCSIVYPPNAPGISRVQCRIRGDVQQGIWIRDEKSRYGVIVNGNRLQPLRWYLLQPKDRIVFAREEYFVL